MDTLNAHVHPIIAEVLNGFVAAPSPTVLRRPALPGFLARRLLRFINPPIPGTRAWLKATCDAELEWSVADWRRIFPGADDHAEYGSHPSEPYRLPHERAAAQVINAHGHMDTFEHLMRRLLQRIPGQRRNAIREDQTAEYRASWQLTLDGTLADYARYLPQLRRALVAYRTAGREYRMLRAEIDAPGTTPCSQRIAA